MLDHLNLFSFENERKGDTNLMVASESFHSLFLLKVLVVLKNWLAVACGVYSYPSMILYGQNKIIKCVGSFGAINEKQTEYRVLPSLLLCLSSSIWLIDDKISYRLWVGLEFWKKIRYVTPLRKKRKTYFHRIDIFSNNQSLLLILFSLWFLLVIVTFFVVHRWGRVRVRRRWTWASWGGRGWAGGRRAEYSLRYLLLLLCFFLLSRLRLLERLPPPYLFLPEGSTINRNPSTFLSFISFTAASAS